MEIKVMSKTEASEAHFNCPHIVISVADDEDQFPDIPEQNCIKVLKIAIWDTKDGMSRRWDDTSFIGYSKIPKNRVFNHIHAREILKFVFTYIDQIDLIVCHCQCGISRSAGIAAALSEILNNEGKRHKLTCGPFYMPNNLIYKKILESYKTHYCKNKDFIDRKVTLDPAL